MGITNFDIVQANQFIGGMIAAQFTGKTFYCDAVNGSDGNSEGSYQKPFQTLGKAYGACRSGKNDTVVLIGDGATTGSQRLSANFTWAKDATHLIGIAAPGSVSNRARIAPTSGATSFANFFTVSGNGCFFQNIQWFHGFTVGGAAAICLTVSGGRNVFVGCHIAGMGSTDHADADDAGSRNLKISTTGENKFIDCTIGIDTVTRSVANASVEFSGGAPRNEFINCVFPFQTSNAGVLGIIVSAAAGSDRWQLFVNPIFINNIKSTSTAMTALATLAASMGGLLLFKNPTLVGITDFGSDATSLAQIYVEGGTTAAATTGIAVNPS